MVTLPRFTWTVVRSSDMRPLPYHTPRPRYMAPNRAAGLRVRMSVGIVSLADVTTDREREPENAAEGTAESRLALVRRARRINRLLAETYPDARAELDFRTP